MDIFIVAPQGGGKTTAAEDLLKLRGYAGRPAVRVHAYSTHPKGDVLFVNQPDDVADVRALAQTIRDARISAVLFDECIVDDTKLLIAVQAVKEARVQTGRDILAIYCQQDQGIRTVANIIETHYLPDAPAVNTFKA